MLAKYTRAITIIILLVTIIAGNFFIAVKNTDSSSTPGQPLQDYLTYFYNRYSRHFDQNGFLFQTPDYEVKEFSPPQSAREILSLALYYKYRALSGEVIAEDKLRAAIFSAEKELASRPFLTQSFSDAFVSLAEVRLFDQLPELLPADQRDRIYQDILKRSTEGIKAADTSNRAALSAVYWQAVWHNLWLKKLLSPAEYQWLSSLAYEKINNFAASDITADGWYLEGTPRKFNPHYHLISAFSFLAYGELTGHPEFISLAEKMTANLRLVSFSNGMVEARLGDRPAGLGAQFYLGLGLLNYRFGYADWSAYLNYASGDRFFSDPRFPNRLEYHSTLYKSAPRYHDDVSFSNLAELALVLPVFAEVKINPSVVKISSLTSNHSTTYQVTNRGSAILFENILFQRTKDGGYTTLQYILPKNYNSTRDLSDTDADGLDNNEEELRGTDPNIPDTDLDGSLDGLEIQNGTDPLSVFNDDGRAQEFFYGKSRLQSLETEQREAQILKLELTKRLGSGRVARIQNSWSALVNAYIYGRYTSAEIADTILSGPRAVHPAIPANVWRESENYKKYLNNQK